LVKSLRDFIPALSWGARRNRSNHDESSRSGKTRTFRHKKPNLPFS
jgi:hypothetical protein